MTSSPFQEKHCLLKRHLSHGMKLQSMVIRLLSQARMHKLPCLLRERSLLSSHWKNRVAQMNVPASSSASPHKSTGQTSPYISSQRTLNYGWQNMVIRNADIQRRKNRTHNHPVNEHWQ